MAPRIMQTFELVTYLHAESFMHDYIACLRKASYTRDRNGLPQRNVCKTFLSKIRGDLSTRITQQYIKDILPENKVIQSYDDLRNDYYEMSDPGWELIVGNYPLSQTKTDPNHLTNDQITVSVKSSIIPWDDLLPENISKHKILDFKILKEHDAISSDLHADIEVQVYFPHECNEKNDSFLKSNSVWGGPNEKKIMELCDAVNKFFDEGKRNSIPTQKVIGEFLKSLKHYNLLIDHTKEVLTQTGHAYLIGHTTAKKIASRVNQAQESDKLTSMRVKEETKYLWKTPFKELCQNMPEILNSITNFPIISERGSIERPATLRAPFKEQKRG